MPWQPARRILGAGAISVNPLPAWLPAAGAWGQVSLNYADQVKAPGSPWGTGGNLDLLFNDFTGVIFNPYMGQYGAYLLHGGGHATSGAYSRMTENTVYAWFADTRQWFRLTEPTYPGVNSSGTSLETLGDWANFKEPPYASDLLQTYGELAPGIPASNHSRWLPCILPPGAGGAAKGSLFVTALRSIHTGGNGGAAYAFRLDITGNTTASWSRVAIGAPNSAVSACVDTSRGHVYHSRTGSYTMDRLDAAAGTWLTVTPSGFVSDSLAGMPMVYAPAHDAIVLMRTDFTLAVMPAGTNPLVMTLKTPTGSAPTGEAPTVGAGGGCCWCPDIGSYGAIVHWNPSTSVVKACYAPSDVLAGTWNWVTLSASNSPAYSVGSLVGLSYNRIQYAPALKSLLVAPMTGITGSGDAQKLNYGGMWAFRASEIA
jgi:hypothetical protein